MQADVIGIGQANDTIPPDSAPPNDNIANATSAFPLPFDDNTNITLATIEPGEPHNSCEAFAGPVSRSVWYFTTSHLSAPMSAQLFDSGGVIAVYAVSFDSTGQVLTEVGCNEAGGAVTFQADSGSSFYFQVYDFQDLGAHLVFHLEQQGQGPTGPPNDNFASAAFVPGVPFSATADFTGATREGDEPAFCGFQNRTVWYAFTPTQTRVVVASLQSPFFNFIGVFTGSSLGNLSPVRCGHSFDPAPFTAVAGTTYFIQLSADFDHTAFFQLLTAATPAGELRRVPIRSVDLRWSCNSRISRSIPRGSASSRKPGALATGRRRPASRQLIVMRRMVTTSSSSRSRRSTGVPPRRPASSRSGRVTLPSRGSRRPSPG